MYLPKKRSGNFDLNVYYDGLCPLCTKEIDIYREKTGSDKINFIDISKPNFNALEEGLDPSRVQKYFHVKKKDASVLTGVDAFIAIWECLDIWRPLQTFAKSTITRPFFDIGYIVFAKVRPIFRRSECENGVCETK